LGTKFQFKGYILPKLNENSVLQWKVSNNLSKTTTALLIKQKAYYHFLAPFSEGEHLQSVCQICLAGKN